MKFLVLLFLLFSFQLSAQETEPSIRDLKAGRYKSDTSFIYSLPYEAGKSYLLIQAYQSNLSHK